MEPRSRTMNALAQALRVDRAWLEHGVGTSPTLTVHLPSRPGTGGADAWRPTGYEPPTAFEIDAPYTTRAPVIEALVASGKIEAVVVSMKAEKHVDGDPGMKNEKYWWERFEHYRTMIEKLIKPPVRDPALDHVPGGTKSQKGES